MGIQTEKYNFTFTLNLESKKRGFEEIYGMTILGN